MFILQLQDNSVSLLYMCYIGDGFTQVFALVSKSYYTSVCWYTHEQSLLPPKFKFQRGTLNEFLLLSDINQFQTQLTLNSSFCNFKNIHKIITYILVYYLQCNQQDKLSTNYYKDALIFNTFKNISYIPFLTVC